MFSINIFLFVFPTPFSPTLSSFSVHPPWKWTINLFSKGIPHTVQAWQPQYEGCCVVNKQFSWASLPFKGTFSSSPDHVKNCQCQRFSAFLLTQRCQMERVRISKHVNPCEGKLSPFLHGAREFIQHVGNFLCLSNKCSFQFRCNMSLNRNAGLWSYSFQTIQYMPAKRTLMCLLVPQSSPWFLKTPYMLCKNRKFAVLRHRCRYIFSSGSDDVTFIQEIGINVWNIVLIIQY